MVLVNNKRSFVLFFSFILFNIILCSSISFAYIDPGTAGAVAGSIWPLILAFLGAIGAFFVKWFWKPIKNMFKNEKKK